jgi:hypothetical protein
MTGSAANSAGLNGIMSATYFSEDFFRVAQISH